MIISDEMKEQLQVLVRLGDEVKEMYEDQDRYEYYFAEYDSPVSQLLGQAKVVMETIDDSFRYDGEN